MFDTTRDELSNTLSDYGYLIADRVSILSVFTDDSQLVAEFRVIDDIVMRGTYLPAWGSGLTPDDVIELLCNDAVRARETEKFNELLDELHFGEAMADNSESEDY